jgi:hypothetical protein
MIGAGNMLFFSVYCQYDQVLINFTLMDKKIPLLAETFARLT